MGRGERKYTQVLTFHDDVYYHIGRRRSISNVDKIQGKFYLYVTWQSEWEKIVSDFKMAIEKKQVEHYFSSIFANFFGIVHIWLFTIRVEPAEETMKFWEIIKFGKKSFFFKYRQQIFFFQFLQILICSMSEFLKKVLLPLHRTQNRGTTPPKVFFLLRFV